MQLTIYCCRSGEPVQDGAGQGGGGQRGPPPLPTGRGANYYRIYQALMCNSYGLSHSVCVLCNTPLPDR